MPVGGARVLPPGVCVEALDQARAELESRAAALTEALRAGASPTGEAILRFQRTVVEAEARFLADMLGSQESTRG